jgi:hypothetical protein
VLEITNANLPIGGFNDTNREIGVPDADGKRQRLNLKFQFCPLTG